MSEQIKITIVMQDEKSNGEKSEESAAERILTQESGLTLMPVLLKNGLLDGSFCGGRGDCGRCVVQFVKGAPLPTGLERSRLEPEELRQGYRLSCMARPRTDCTVRIVEAEEQSTPIVTEMNLLSEKNDLNGQQKNLSVNQKSLAIESDAGQKEDAEKAVKKAPVIPENQPDAERKKDGCYIIAVDLGTTTVAMQLRDTATGAVADTYCAMNPQRRYGTDVLARIQASVDGHGGELCRLACGVILEGLSQFAAHLQGKTDAKVTREGARGEKADANALRQEEAGGEKAAPVWERVTCMCIAGNTAMQHLLLGYDVTTLGRAPFVPVETGVHKTTAARLFEGMEKLPENLRGAGGGLPFDFSVYMAPCISAFVGGDIVAGLYALGLFSPERRATLFIDLGTNGEMALMDGGRMLVTATAAGPAFEGDGTMIGTDRIALTAQLLRRGILDSTGLLEEPYFTDGVSVDPNGKICGGTDVTPAAGEKNRTAAGGRIFRQKDIRALQMAKAAIRAGVEILWERMGRPEIETVFLAGGFGYYLDVEAAVAIGLLPSHMRGRVRAAGNTSLAGAYELGRDLSGNRLDVVRLEERTGLAESINLAETERFEELYLRYMELGEN